MKKWIILAAVASIAAFAQAAPKTMTKAQFIEAQKKRAEKSGRTFKQANVEKRFEKLDTNKDGKLSVEERKAGQKNKKDK